MEQSKDIKDLPPELQSEILTKGIESLNQEIGRLSIRRDNVSDRRLGNIPPGIDPEEFRRANPDFYNMIVKNQNIYDIYTRALNTRQERVNYLHAYNQKIFRQND